MMAESVGEWPDMTLIALIVFRWDGEAERQVFFEFMKQKGVGDCEIFTKFSFMLPTKCVRFYARKKSRIASGMVLTTSMNMSELPILMRGCEDARIASFFDPPPDKNLSSTGLSLHRPVNDRQFNAREKNIVELAHRFVLPMIGRQLASASEPAPSDLSPRLQDVLNCLLEGDSEMQIAIRLNLTPQTDHQYAKAVYRHFNINSRPQLLAIWIRRTRPEC